jgi:chaperone required for assembly of F1-ATPase
VGEYFLWNLEELKMSRWTKRRTWENITIKKIGDSFEVYLDDETLLTPKKNKLSLPTQKLASKVATEWEHQVDIIDPTKMPYSRLANSAIDKVKDNCGEVVLDLLNYGDTDLLCYRAESPKELVLRQKQSWDPILLWASNELTIDLKTISGINYKPQDAIQLTKVAEVINSFDCFTLTGFYDLVTISGSMLVALSLYHKYITPEVALDLSFLDEDWQREKWGYDEESTINRINKLQDLKTASKFLMLLA